LKALFVSHLASRREGTYLHTGDPNTDVSSLNHADVVGTVSNSEKRGAGTPLDEFNDESLL
jgi:hypothetical protein